MVKNKLNVKLILVVITALIILFGVYSIYSGKKADAGNVLNDVDQVEKIDDAMLYDKEIKGNYDIVELMSNGKPLVRDGSFLYTFNIDSNEIEEKVFEAREGYKIDYVKSNGENIFIVESKDNGDEKVELGDSQNNKDQEVSIYYKENLNSEAKLIDKAKSIILPYINTNNEYATYYIIDEEKNTATIKLMDLKTKKNKGIYTDKFINSDNSETMLFPPNIYKNEITWSSGTHIWIYNIESGKSECINKNDKIYAPVLLGDKILGVKINEHKEDGVDEPYSSNFIVEIDRTTGKYKKFEEGEVDKYIKSPRETVFMIEKNSDYIVWETSFGFRGSIYDLKNNKFVTLKKNVKEYLGLFNVLAIRDNTICYKLTDQNDKEGTYIYTFK